MPVLLSVLLSITLLAAYPSLVDAAEERPICFGKRATVWIEKGIGEPTPGDDVIVGTDASNEIEGLGGDDLICGGGQGLGLGTDEDVIYGGAGNDRISTDPGNDWVFGGAGADLILGKKGRDVLDGEGGDDEIRGGPQDDNLAGRGGDDLLVGGEGGPKDLVDSVAYGPAPKGIHGDLGRGVVTGWGHDKLIGVEGLVGSFAHPNTLIGDNGINALRGGSADDVILAGAGGDLVDGEGGDDRLEGGAGVDTLEFIEGGREDGVNVDLVAGVATRGPDRDRLSGIEYVYGTFYNDVIIGNDLRNYIDSREGDDTIEGRGGDDALHGWLGFDVLRGGDGRDYCEYGQEVTDCEELGPSD